MPASPDEDTGVNLDPSQKVVSQSLKLNDMVGLSEFNMMSAVQPGSREGKGS